MNKKIASIISILGLSALLFAESATVTFVKGKVEVQRNGKWIALNVGDSINENEVVNTGFQSEAKIKMNDSYMTLGALTRITLTELKSGKNSQTVNVSLSTGAVRSKVNHVENTRVNYSVRSPVAVASVRGTDYVVRADGFTSCFEGGVAVYPSRVEVKELVSDEIPVEEYDEEAIPENYGSADSTTPASEIAPSSPVGTVVVGKGQQSSFNTSGNPEKPIDNAARRLNSVVNSVQTAAEAEVVVAGGSTTVLGGTSKTADNTPKSGLKVKVTFE